MRERNTDRHGCSFSRIDIINVWLKGRTVQGYDPAQVRMDSCGALIAFADYGQATTNGWEIDHVQPVARGGGDELANLQPLWWANNRHKSDDWPYWTCLYPAA